MARTRIDTKNNFERNPEDIRKFSKLRLKQLEYVVNDLRELTAQIRRREETDRREWAAVVNEAKALLEAHELSK
jgi:hypothetical protein